MNDEKYLLFLNNISKNKPTDINKNQKVKCPFCNRSNLKNIIDEDGPFVLLENKYPTLENTYQLVLIETYKCGSNISEYNIEYLKKLLKFGMDKWLELERSNKYKSVIFYKNHGPRAGGSLLHPHMQIVGINNIDYKKNLEDYYFDGLEIYKNNDCLVNLSDKPISGFTEFNIIINDSCEKIDELAINLKKITHYILNNYFTKCDSFNLYFYHIQRNIVCKISPRFTTSPLLLGYCIKQVSSIAQNIVDELKGLYY